MSKLTNMHAVLLSAAAQRDDGNLLPPPDTLGPLDNRIRKSIEALIRRSLVDTVPVTTSLNGWRSEDDGHWAAVVTDAGRQAIGIVSDRRETDDRPSPAAAPNGAKASHNHKAGLATPNEPRQTKAALVLSLLQRSEGATLTELVEATGWLPHTTRAALTSLRKKGHGLAKGKRGEITCYSLVNAA